jgi:hypothetical protein
VSHRAHGSLRGRDRVTQGGWVDANGDKHEKVYDIVWSGDREMDADGKAPAVGSTVDVENASSQRDFYYVRVLEIPTPRWTTYDAKILGGDLPDDVPTSIQERAIIAAGKVEIHAFTGCGDSCDPWATVEHLRLAKPKSRSEQVSEVRTTLVRCDLEGKPSGDDTPEPVRRFAKPIRDLAPWRSAKRASR